MSLRLALPLSLLFALSACQCGAPAGAPDPDAGSEELPADAATAASCDPSPCTIAGRGVCAVEGGVAVCHCDPGTHDEGGLCAKDTVCTATTCGGHGTCSGSGAGLTCACDSGFIGSRCGSCDEPKGFHADGKGGCTSDPCLPDPCSSKANTRCAPATGGFRCECLAGFHAQGTSCVKDEVCTATTCSGHGACSLVGGVTSCACSSGYAGPSCATCATGFHADGAGGCTNDVCLPNPCAATNQTVCAKDSTKTTGYRCDCDAGFHADGMGGCTNDVCLPNPCAAMNQACRAGTNGTYQCFTPVCDDGNPCTTDTVAGGACVFTAVKDGTTCSLSMCQTGGSCQAGKCSGTTPVSCDDANPCTRDSCDPKTGCAHVNDDTLVPDDGKSCTVDKCVAGQKQNTATDSLCDDGKYCSGVEVCRPADPKADARGCLATNVPTPPPAPGPCQYYGACSETTKSFPLLSRATGAACNDGIACSTGDTCRSDGSCQGTLGATCGALSSCSSPTPFTGDIDFSMAAVAGRFTFNGGAVPSSDPSGGEIDVYLVDVTTGTRMYIGGPRYSGTGYPLVAGSDRFTAKALPGLYDVLYRRNLQSNSAYGNYVYSTDANDTVPNGDQVLRRNVALYAGSNALDIDFGMTTVSGKFTFRGGPVPSSDPSGGEIDLYLVDQSTGTRMYIGGPRYSGTGYPLVAGSDGYTVKALPGTYDVLYRRNLQSNSAYGNYVYSTDANDTVPNGDQVLMKGVVLSGSTKTLNIDFGMTTVSGKFTLNGGAVPSSDPAGGEIDLYLVDESTGTRMYIGGPRYSGTGYPLVAGSDSYTAKVLPGTYDVLYRRNLQSNSAYGNYVYTTAANDTVANGDQVLVKGIVVSGTTKALNIDFGLTTVSGKFTFNGGAVPSSDPAGGEIDLYLVDESTGTRMYLGGPRYSGTGYPLVAGTDSYTVKALPGTYDVLYRRNLQSNSAYGNYVYTTDPKDTVANGDQVLLKGIVVSGATKALNIDFGMTTVSGKFTFNGGAVPSSDPSGGEIDLYLVDESTGTRMYLGGPRYSGTGYPLVSGTDSYTVKALPGTYDVLYRRNLQSNSAYGNYVYSTDPNDTVANGDQVLLKGIVVSGATKSLGIDFGLARPAGAFTFNGGAVPPSDPSGGEVDVYLVDRSTGTRMYLGGPRYSGTGYPLVAGTDRYAAKSLPGSYDLLYRRNLQSNSAYGNYVYSTDPNDTVANGDQVLRSCLLVK